MKSHTKRLLLKMNNLMAEQEADQNKLTANQLFDELQNQFYTSWFRFHPEEGVDAGNESSAENLRSYDEDDIGALLALNKKLVFALTEINTVELDEPRRLDYRLMLGAVEIEIRDQEGNDWRYINPNDYLPVKAVYQLLIHPVENVHRAIKRRLELFPEHLRGAKLLLSQQPERVVPMWLDSAIEQCATGSSFIRKLGRHPLILKRFSNPARLQPSYDAAANALDDFSLFLDKEIKPKAAGNFACGADRFNRLLNSKHFLGLKHEDLLRFGERLFEDTQKQILKQTTLMKSDNVKDLLKKIQKKHPKGQKLLDRYRKRMRDTYKWLSQSDLLTMPEVQSLKVQETPEFMRPIIPFAAYEPPAPNDPDQHGLYYVTTVEEDALLAEHNNFSIDLTCVHEAFPGHHLQFVLANQRHKNNLSRLVNISASMYEGWALYCEELAVEQKFLNKKEHVFMMLRDRLWRALRIIIDVKIQTGQITVSQAVDLLIEKLSFERTHAEAELRWYCASPTTPSCYAIGRELLVTARKICVENKEMTLKEFHDAFLAQGSIAMPLAIHGAFGSDVWKQVYADVFGDRHQLATLSVL